MKKILLLVFVALLSITAIAQSPALSFNGTDNEITWSETTGVLRTSANHTWEMWVKGASTTVGVLYTEGWGGSNYRAQFRIHADGAGKLKIEYRTYDGTYLIPRNSLSTSTVFDGTWHHIAIVGTTDGGGMTSTVLYVDGVADATDLGSYLRPTVWDNTDGGSLNKSVIGQIARASQRIDNSGHSSNPYTWYNGEVDEFRAWTRALDVSEIANNKCEPLNTTGLHRHVKFDEGSGTTFADQVGGAAGTLTGTTSGANYTTNTSCTATSIDELVEQKSKLLFPNPANDVLNLNDKVLNVEIYNVSGNLAKKAVNTGNSVGVADLSSGVYIVKAVLSDGTVETLKLIKR